VAKEPAGAGRGDRDHRWRRQSVARRRGDRNAREVGVALPQTAGHSKLKQSGVYALVRHPIYGGILLLSLAWSLARSPSALIPTGALAIALLFKSRLEERWLIDRHPAYAGYQERVRRRFVPYLW
jgi:protein-S-isoprenylcysteine O-methyltransferase Ste14